MVAAGRLATALGAQLAPLLDDVLARTGHLTLDDVAQTAPLLELCQTLQDRLYARLFQS